MSIEAPSQARVVFEATMQSATFPRDRLGNIRWRRLYRESPEVVVSFIEDRVREFVGDTEPFNSHDLSRAGMDNLRRLIRSYYPGSYRALREKLNLPASRRNNFWNTDKGMETMRQQASEFYQSKGGLSQKLLHEGGRDDLAVAIGKNYPGRLSTLKQELGIPSKSKPAGFWTPERIEAEVLQAISREGIFTTTSADNLKSIIRRNYPGGLRQLRINLGLVALRRDRPWDEESIRAEAHQFYLEKGGLSQKLLGSEGRHDLLGGIAKYYPGGLNKLLEDLSLDLNRRPNGYWTPERMEEETLLFYQTFGDLSASLLRKQSRQDLLTAISKYPGQLTALKEKLGITSNVQNSISPEEANEQLKRLLE